MFDLVADVERYPEFVPLCTGMTVRRRYPDLSGRMALEADMSVGYKAIAERFVTRVILDMPKFKVVVNYVDGPFSHLENIWNIRPHGPRACRVDFFIDYEFRSRLLGRLMGTMFDTAFRKFADAFEARADEVYGRGNVLAYRPEP